MQHVRAQARANAVRGLAGLPTTADQVFPARTRPLADGHAPCLLVYVRRETSDVDAMGDPSQAALMRSLVLVVEVRVSLKGEDAAEAAEALLDAIAAEVEVAMMSDCTLGGIAREVTLTSTEIEVIAPGESHNGRALLTYRIVYRTRENAPATAV